MRASRVVACISLVAVAALAGCFGKETTPNGDGPSPTTPGETATDSSSTQPPVTIPLTPLHELLMTNCIGWDAFRNYPAAVSPGTSPEGWESATPDSIVTVLIFGFRCERVAIGPYERGPVHILLDTHGNAEVPEGCSANQNGITRFRVLQHFVTDDAEVAAYMQATYGVPVLTASFQESDQDVAAGALHTWMWAVEGQPPSTMTIVDYKQNENLPTVIERLFWQRGAGLVALEIEVEQKGAITNLFANGTVQAPFLLAQDTAGIFVGQGDWRTDLNGHGVFTTYQDRLCKEPAT